MTLQWAATSGELQGGDGTTTDPNRADEERFETSKGGAQRSYWLK